MANKPYKEMIELMREQGAINNPIVLDIAMVVRTSPELIIQYRELELKRSDLLVNPELITQIIYNNVILRDTIKVGDNVVIQPTQDGQKYIVLAKVV